ncbi:MAG: hypothetical protein HZC55_13345 [Verrucomicrobia bacterium]|nr:hypothetical protein [Verrucomicrobiota bacterium]
MPASALTPSWLPRRGRPIERPLELMYSIPAVALADHPDWLDRVLDYPTGQLSRWVQVHHGHLFELAPLPRWSVPGHVVNAQRQEVLRRTIERCHARRVRVAWMVGKLTPPAGLLAAHPALADLHTGAYWLLVEEAVGEILAALPGLDEFSVYLFESPPFLDAHHFFGGFHHGSEASAWPYLAPADLLRALLQAMSRACRRAGRSFSVLTHVWYPFQEQILAAALGDWPDDLPLLLEHNYSTGDFNPHLPENALLASRPHLRHGLLFCGGLEYAGLGEIPFCCPELMQERIASAWDHTPRLERLSFRPIWEDRCLLGTPNEVNLAAAVALAANPWQDTDGLWLAWARPHFGAGAPAAIAALQEAAAANLAVFFQGGTRTNDHSALPGFDYLRSRAFNYGKALIEWQPTPRVKQDLWEMLIAPGDRALRRNRELHAGAEAAAARAGAVLAALPSDLRTSSGLPLGQGLDLLREWIRVHRRQMEALLRWRRHTLAPEGGELPELEQVLAQLDAGAAALEAADPPVSPLIAPARVRRFTTELRRALAATPATEVPPPP